MRNYINNVERLHGCAASFFDGFEGCRAISAVLNGWEGRAFDGRVLMIGRLRWRTDAEAQDTVRSAASSGAGF